MFVPEAVRVEVSDAAWVRAMLDAETALAQAQADVGLITRGAAEAVARACEAEFDPGELAIEGRNAANPVVPLVRRLRETAPEAHYGATSQDILDTAAGLVALRALAPVDEDFHGAVAACARLADGHRETRMAGRTLMQQAQPTTFGLKAAGWRQALTEAQDALYPYRLPAQLGGATGTLAQFGDRWEALVDGFAEYVDLYARHLPPWHANRVPIADLAMKLALAAGTVEKVALDIILLAQSEVGEVAEASEGGRGGSSAMAHKRNPVGSIRARAAARSVRGAVSVLLEAMAGEHERAAGAWQSEWGALSSALAGTGGAVWSLREALEGLTVDPERMAANAEGLPGELDMDIVNALIDRALEFE